MKGKPHAIGPFVNIYNEGTRDYFARNGATSICLPFELGQDALAALANDTPVPLEVMVFGRLPLAISARCYHARAHNLHKDGCQYICNEDPDGLDVRTLDGEPFLAVNGVQTMSYAYTDLSASIADLQAMGINRLRLSPHSNVDMVEVAKLYREVANGVLEAQEAHAKLSGWMEGAEFCNGYIKGVNGHLFNEGA